MSHKQFIYAYESAPLGYLIRIPRALSILLTHKTRDARFQSLLVKSICACLAVLGAGLCGFQLMPMLLAVGVLAHVACLFSWILWLAAGDILLKFALEDERFFQLATGCKALSVFADTEFSLPQPEN
jgi:hypothetical protein